MMMLRMLFLLHHSKFIFSDSVHASAETQVGTLQFTAMVPVIKVVAAMLTAGLLPCKWTSVSLMVDQNALLESGIEVLARITAVHRDLHSIKFIRCVLTRLKFVIWDADVVVEERHV